MFSSSVYAIIYNFASMNGSVTTQIHTDDNNWILYLDSLNLLLCILEREAQFFLSFLSDEPFYDVFRQWSSNKMQKKTPFFQNCFFLCN